MTDSLKKFTELIGKKQSDIDRNKLILLEGLMANAIKEKDWDSVLKIMDKADFILRKLNATRSGNMG